MNCPRCGHANPPDAELCQKCRGVRFVRLDAASSKTKKPGDTGKVKAPDATPTQPPRPSADRRTPLPPPAAPPAPPPVVREPVVLSPVPSPIPEDQHVLTRVGAPPLELTPGKPFTFGRDTTTSFCVPAKKVSRLHAEITWEDDKPVIADKGSANGTLVNGLPVQKRKLTSGDEIQIGPFICVYQFGDASFFRPRENSATLAEKGEVLAGSIGPAGLSETLQNIEFNQKTGTLSVFARGAFGQVLVQEGVPLHAEANGVEDDAAVLYLLDLEQGRFAFVPELKSAERTMKSSFTAMLLEWNRRVDEKKRNTPAP